MEIVCLDMEGTLTPEIWEQIALNTGLKNSIKQLEIYLIMKNLWI